MKKQIARSWSRISGAYRFLICVLLFASLFMGTLHALLPLIQNSEHVFPKVISPNNDGINDRVFFIFENSTAASSKGVIYDIRSQKVADVQESSLYVPNNVVLTWDGTDETGAVVAGGVYIYKVEVADKVYSGTVGVVR